MKPKRAKFALADSSSPMLLVPKWTRFNISAKSVSAQISRYAGEEREEPRGATESCIVSREASGFTESGEGQPRHPGFGCRERAKRPSITFQLGFREFLQFPREKTEIK